VSAEKKQDAYKRAGVDIDAATEAVSRFKGKVKDTFTDRVISDVGNFGGMFSMAGLGMEEPVLVSSSDGVGTKLIVACKAGKHDTVGHCLVNHCVDDIMVQGARPLFFMDYISTGKLDPTHVNEVMQGFIDGCKENGVALLGGETAEMPDLYSAGDYDLAGFIVGVADRKNLLTGERVKPGHILVGMPSSGLHTNGYSLARNIVFEQMGLDVNDPLPGCGGKTAGEALLAVHKSYKKPLEVLLERNLIDAAAHITGGGLSDNLPRVYGKGMHVEIETTSWDVPPLFQTLVREGGVEELESYRVFNMGIGMVVFVAEENLDEVAGVIGMQGEEARIIGRMVKGDGAVSYI
jgi:phosphoribosylformylglycinamidine cyclo-ligase